MSSKNQIGPVLLWFGAIALITATTQYSIIKHDENHQAWARILDNHIADQNRAIAHLEGRIALHEGQATLTAGRTCIIDADTLADEYQAVQYVRACVRAAQE